MEFQADLLLKGAEVFHPIFQKFIPANLYILDGKIYHIDFEPNDENLDRPVPDITHDWTGKQIIPGFIDIHMHIESSMLTPISFANEVLPRGVTTVVAEPHEIANVFGVQGIKHFIEAGKRSAMDIFIALPSSVPSTRADLESNGCVLSEKEMMELYKMPEVISVGEVMNYRDIIDKDCDLPIAHFLKDLSIFDPRATIEGHCPQLTGFELSRFLWHRIQGDHTEHNLEEIKDRVRRGMFIELQMKMLKKDILDYLTKNELYDCFSFITDDTMPDSLVNEGQLDAVLRRAIDLGVDRNMAFYCASETPARRMKLCDRGRLLPGYLADCVVIEKDKSLNIVAVYKNGKKIDPKDKQKLSYDWPAEYKNSINIPELKPSDFIIRKDDLLKNFSLFTSSTDFSKLPEELRQLVSDTVDISNPFSENKINQASDGSNRQINIKLRVMELQDGSTRIKQTIKSFIFDIDNNCLLLNDTKISSNEKIAKLACINRYSGKGEKSFALVTGDMIKEGAIASTWSHDSHNLMVMGHSDEDMAIASSRLHELGGGIVAVKNGKILAELKLEIAGIVTEEPAEICAKQLSELRQAWTDLGYNHYNPFMSFGTLGLLVSPSIKLSDKGLISVEHASRLPLIDIPAVSNRSAEAKKLTQKLIDISNEKEDPSVLLDFERSLYIDKKGRVLPSNICPNELQSKHSSSEEFSLLSIKVRDYTPENPEKGFVPCYYISIFLDEEHAGNILLRTRPWQNVVWAGNIGYRIFPKFRGRNLLTPALYLMEDLGRHLGNDYWIIANKEWNYASRTVCEKLACTYLGCFELPEDSDLRIEGEDEKMHSFIYMLGKNKLSESPLNNKN